MSARPAQSSPFQGWLVGVLIAVSLFGFLATIALAAWSPELQDRDRAGLHPYSTSALGYNGLYRLLQARGTPVTISRSRQRLETDRESLKIVTLAPGGMGEALDELDLSSSQALVVLPKWSGPSDRDKPQWQRETSLVPTGTVERLLQVYDPDGGIWRLRTPARIDTGFGRYSPRFGEDMQVLRADSLVSVVSVAGGDLVARLPGSDIYVLSDPDLFNTAGLAEAENARMALGLVDFLRDDTRQPVLLDATLHGFERSENLLQMMFDIPFLGATLIALLGFLMIGWAGAVRFGAPEDEGRAIALGKQALTDNTARLVAMARRERQLAPGYLALVRRHTAKEIGAPKTLSEADLSALFDRLGPQAPRFSDLESDLNSPAQGREDLLNKARALWRWRRETTHGHQ